MKRLLLVMAILVGLAVSASTASAGWGRRAYYRGYYGRPYASPAYYGWGNYYRGPAYYYGPNYYPPAAGVGVGVAPGVGLGVGVY